MDIKLLISIYSYGLFLLLMFFAFFTAYPVFWVAHLWSSKPRKYFQKIVQFYFRIFYFLLPNIGKISIFNRCNANAYHPCVYASSHQSSLDYTLLATLIDDYVTPSNHFISDFPLFMKIPKHALGVHYIPKGNLDMAHKSYDSFIQALQSGSSVIIFPEGTRNSTSNLLRFKGGAFRLAIAENVPVVPIIIDGTGQIVTKGSNITKTTKKKDIKITFLDPVYPQEQESFVSLGKRVRQIMQNHIDNHKGARK